MLFFRHSRRYSGRRCGCAKRRLNIGQSLVETLAGFIILIPLGLFSYDLTFILIANQNNEKLADNAARAAANHGDNRSAQLAAQQAIDDFEQTSNSNYGKITLVNFDYNTGGSGQVVLITQMDMKLPVAFGAWQSVTISAKSVEPIVGIPVAR